jgi:hypothetical protein
VSLHCILRRHGNKSTGVHRALGFTWACAPESGVLGTGWCQGTLQLVLLHISYVQGYQTFLSRRLRPADAGPHRPFHYCLVITARTFLSGGPHRRGPGRDSVYERDINVQPFPTEHCCSGIGRPSSNVELYAHCAFCGGRADTHQSSEADLPASSSADAYAPPFLANYPRLKPPKCPLVTMSATAKHAASHSTQHCTHYHYLRILPANVLQPSLTMRTR